MDHRRLHDRAGLAAGDLRLPSCSIGVGADWLRVRSTRADDWVQTNQLVRLALEIRWINRYLVMEDCDGRKLRVHLDELRGNRRVIETFLSGVRRARSTGLTLNKATTTEFGLR
jgi:hypothetical protein